MGDHQERLIAVYLVRSSVWALTCDRPSLNTLDVTSVVKKKNKFKIKLQISPVEVIDGCQCKTKYSLGFLKPGKLVSIINMNAKTEYRAGLCIAQQTEAYQLHHQGI
jgi:hypothetical protein